MLEVSDNVQLERSIFFSANERKKENGHLIYIRTLRIWNTLSDELNLGMNNVDDFKHALMCYYSTAL